jgi:small subunit ribosomal protein S14
MAKKSVVARNKRRSMSAHRSYEARTALRKIIKSTEDEDARLDAMLRLQKQPRNRSHIRVRHRCRSCERPRGVYQRFGLCRLCLRGTFSRGEIPGLRKSSWG